MIHPPNRLACENHFRAAWMTYFNYYYYSSGLETAIPSCATPVGWLLLSLSAYIITFRNELAYWNPQFHYIPSNWYGGSSSSLTDSTPTVSAFTSEPNPSGITSSRLLRGKGNIEGVLRAVLRAKQVAKQEVGAPILPLHRASEQPNMGYMGHFLYLSHGKKRTNYAKFGQNSQYDPFHLRRAKCIAGSSAVSWNHYYRSNNAVMEGDFSLEAGSAGNGTPQGDELNKAWCAFWEILSRTTRITCMSTELIAITFKIMQVAVDTLPAPPANAASDDILLPF